VAEEHIDTVVVALVAVDDVKTDRVAGEEAAAVVAVAVDGDASKGEGVETDDDVARSAVNVPIAVEVTVYCWPDIRRTGGHGFGTAYRALAKVLAGTCGSGAEDKQCNVQHTAELPETCTVFALGRHGSWLSQWSPAGRAGPGRGNGGGGVGPEDALAAQPTPVLMTVTRCRGRCEAGSAREAVDVAETCGRSRG